MPIRAVVAAVALATLTACGPATPALSAPSAPATSAPATSAPGGPGALAPPKDLAPALAPGAPLAVIPFTHPVTVTGNYAAHCTVHTVPGGTLPDPICTPGSLGDLVTQATITTTICAPNWTATVRPPTAATDRIKTVALAVYGMPTAARATTELDHKVPLELGGSDDVTNLWPQPSDLPGKGFRNTKDTVENTLKVAVCSKQVTLHDAQIAIATDWTTARARLHV